MRRWFADSSRKYQPSKSTGRRRWFYRQEGSVEPHVSGGLLNITTSGCRSDNYAKDTCVAAPYKAAHLMPVSFLNSAAPKVWTLTCGRPLPINSTVNAQASAEYWFAHRFEENGMLTLHVHTPVP